VFHLLGKGGKERGRGLRRGNWGKKGGRLPAITIRGGRVTPSTKGKKNGWRTSIEGRKKDGGRGGTGHASNVPGKHLVALLLPEEKRRAYLSII